MGCHFSRLFYWPVEGMAQTGGGGVRVVGWHRCRSPTGLWLDIALLIQRVGTLRLKGKGPYITPPSAADFRDGGEAADAPYAPGAKRPQPGERAKRCSLTTLIAVCKIVASTHFRHLERW